jgi:hypothetical protein
MTQKKPLEISDLSEKAIRKFQRDQKKRGVRASRNSGNKGKQKFRDEDIERHSAIVPILKKRLEMVQQGSEVTSQEIHLFTKVNAALIKQEEETLKKVLNEEQKALRKAAKASKTPPIASPSLLSIFGVASLPMGFTHQGGRRVSVLLEADKANKAKQLAEKNKTRRPLPRNDNLKGVPLIKSSSRVRVNDDFKVDLSLAKLRTRTWFAYLLESTRPSAINRSMHVYTLNQIIRYFCISDEGIKGIPDIKLAFENWLISENKQPGPNFNRGLPHHFYDRSYELGECTPTLATLSLFDAYVPGSKSVYDEGFYQIPLWAVLSGDIKSCRALCAAQNWQTGLFQSMEQDFYDLMLNLFSDDAVPDLDDLKRYIQSICTGVGAKGMLTGSIHPAIETRIDSFYSIVDASSSNDIYEINDDGDRELISAGPSRLSDDQISTLPVMSLVAFALLKICIDQKSGPILQLEWLVMGLCCGLYADLFTADIQEHIFQDLRLNGDLITKHFQSVGVQIIPFDQRWSSYGLY